MIYNSNSTAQMLIERLDPMESYRKSQVEQIIKDLEMGNSFGEASDKMPPIPSYVHDAVHREPSAGMKYVYWTGSDWVDSEGKRIEPPAGMLENHLAEYADKYPTTSSLSREYLPPLPTIGENAQYPLPGTTQPAGYAKTTGTAGGMLSGLGILTGQKKAIEKESPDALDKISEQLREAAQKKQFNKKEADIKAWETTGAPTSTIVIEGSERIAVQSWELEQRLFAVGRRLVSGGLLMTEPTHSELEQKEEGLLNNVLDHQRSTTVALNHISDMLDTLERLF